MNDSILNTIKKMLGIELDYTAFDEELIRHINGAFMILGQLGVPFDDTTYFKITGPDEIWANFIKDETNIESVINDVYFRVRLWWDPPTNSYAVSAMERQNAELDWRLSVEEEVKRTNAESGSTTDEL